jgi:penicillin amidase
MIQVMKAQNGYEKWCDDVRTPAKETCAMQSAKAFDLAGAYLKKHYGRRSQWRWGPIHAAAGDHRPFSFVPVISRFFSVAPETPGDGFTVDVGHFFMAMRANLFANRHAASMRAIYDLADLERSLFIHSTGQSGNFLSPWYSNMAERCEGRIRDDPDAARGDHESEAAGPEAVGDSPSSSRTSADSARVEVSVWNVSSSL